MTHIILMNFYSQVPLLGTYPSFQTKKILQKIKLVLQISDIIKIEMTLYIEIKQQILIWWITKAIKKGVSVNEKIK